MIRNRIKVLLSFIFLGVLFSSTALAVPTVYLDLLDSSIAVGDTFQVEVWADGDENELDLLSFSFDVEAGSSGIIDFTGYTVESGFDDDTGLTGNDVAGSVFPGITGNDVLLATLSFTALSAGTDILSIIGLYDESFLGIYYELEEWSLIGYDIDASLTIAINTISTPEPGTILLLGIGLIGLTRINRKFKR